MDYTIIIAVIFGIAPSLIWLTYYLRKDLHPEPKKMIFKIFLWGAAITIPVFFVQVGLALLLDSLNLGATLKSILYWFIVISFTEELFKYLVIKLKVLNSRHLDEPLDLMLYMVVAALGFAALENILYLFTPAEKMSLDQLIDRTLVVDLIRFIGAIFLHTLCSATIGYSLAVSACEPRFKKFAVVSGIGVATLLHGFYDFSIMTLEGYARFVVPAIIILALAFMVFTGFEKLKKMKGVCPAITGSRRAG